MRSLVRVDFRCTPLKWELLWLKMLPQFYQACLQKYLTSTLLLNLKLLVVILQLHKQGSGGYDLEESQPSAQRLTRLALLIAIAYTIRWINGQKLQQRPGQKYINRLKELQRSHKRHSQFWVGNYGYLWVATMELCSDLVISLMSNQTNKLPFFKKRLESHVPDPVWSLATLSPPSGSFH